MKTLVLGGRSLQVAFTMPAIDDFEMQHGKSITSVVSGDLGVRALANLLAAGVRAAGDRKFQREDALSAIQAEIDTPGGRSFLMLAKDVVGLLRDEGVIRLDTAVLPSPGAVSG